MVKRNVMPTAESTAADKVIWLHIDGQSQPDMHVLNGECECKTCASKITHIILLSAA